MRSPMGDPPGSLVVMTRIPRSSRQPCTTANWVDFPAPSMPSRVMSLPASIMVVTLAELITPNRPVVLFQSRREMVTAIPLGHEIEAVTLLRMKDRVDGLASRQGYGRWRQALVDVGVVGRVAAQVGAGEIAVERISQAVDDGRVRLQHHPMVQAADEHTGDGRSLGGQIRSLSRRWTPGSVPRKGSPRAVRPHASPIPLSVPAPWCQRIAAGSPVRWRPWRSDRSRGRSAPRDARPGARDWP